MRLSKGNNAIKAANIPLSLLPEYVTTVRIEPPIIKYKGILIIAETIPPF